MADQTDEEKLAELVAHASITTLTSYTLMEVDVETVYAVRAAHGPGVKNHRLAEGY